MWFSLFCLPDQLFILLSIPPQELFTGKYALWYRLSLSVRAHKVHCFWHCPQPCLNHGNSGNQPGFPSVTVLPKPLVQILWCRTAEIRHWNYCSCSHRPTAGATESTWTPSSPFCALAHRVSSWTLPSHGLTSILLWCSAGTEFTVPPAVCKSMDPMVAGKLRFHSCFWSCGAPGGLLSFQPCLHMWATHRHLCPPRTHRGGAAPAVSVQKMSLLWWDPALPSSTHFNNGTSVAEPGSFLCASQVVAGSTLKPLQAISMQPIPVLSPGLSFGAQVLAPSPHMHQHTPVLTWGMQQGGRDPLCWSVCVLLQTGCCTLLWASEAPSLSQLISLLVKALLRVRKRFLFHSSLPGVQVLSLFLLFFFQPIGYMVIFLAILILWDLLSVFSRYSVRIFPQVDVFLMCLWEKVSSVSFYSALWSGPRVASYVKVV